MAIDTNNEKLALITLLQPWNVPVPISADGIDQVDKQHLLAGYPGIVWGEDGEGLSSAGSSAFCRMIMLRHGARK